MSANAQEFEHWSIHDLHCFIKKRGGKSEDCLDKEALVARAKSMSNAKCNCGTENCECGFPGKNCMGCDKEGCECKWMGNKYTELGGIRAGTSQGEPEQAHTGQEEELLTDQCSGQQGKTETGKFPGQMGKQEVKEEFMGQFSAGDKCQTEVLNKKTCFGCQKCLDPAEFSDDQWKLGGNAKCKSCITCEQEGKKLCFGCQQCLDPADFSEDQRKLISNAKCKKCITCEKEGKKLCFGCEKCLDSADFSEDQRKLISDAKCKKCVSCEQGKQSAEKPHEAGKERANFQGKKSELLRG